MEVIIRTGYVSNQAFRRVVSFSDMIDSWLAVQSVCSGADIPTFLIGWHKLVGPKIWGSTFDLKFVTFYTVCMEYRERKVVKNLMENWKRDYTA